MYQLHVTICNYAERDEMDMYGMHYSLAYKLFERDVGLHLDIWGCQQLIGALVKLKRMPYLEFYVKRWLL